MRAKLLLSTCLILGCATHKPRAIAPVSDAPAETDNTCPMLGEQEAADESPACRAGDETACQADCSASRAYGCFAVALIHEQNGNDEAAAKYYRRTCQLGAAIGCTNLGAYAFSGKAKVAPACATALFEAACGSGESFGCGMIGRVYAEGFGVTPDPARARKILEVSCKELGGFPCFALGSYLQKGTFGEPDAIAARRAYERACATNYKPACAELEGSEGTKF